MERCAGLGQRARRVARLDDDRAFGEGAHRDIALREEEPGMLGRLLGVATNGHLRAQELIAGDLLLQISILLGVVAPHRRSDNGTGMYSAGESTEGRGAIED